MLILAGGVPSAVVVSAGTGGEYLLTPDPKEVWVSTPAMRTIDLDYGVAITADTFFIGATNAATDDSFQIFSATDMAGAGAAALHAATPIRAGGALAPYHAFLKLAEPVTSRYFRIVLTGVADIELQVGLVRAGKAFQPAYNREWGSGRSIIDTGTREELLGGGFGIGEGAIKAGYRWTFGDLSDAEIDALWSLARSCGETRTMLVVEDPDRSDGLNERIHYGLFNRFEAYERTSPGNTRWSMSMTEWA